MELTTNGFKPWLRIFRSSQMCHHQHPHLNLQDLKLEKSLKGVKNLIVENNLQSNWLVKRHP